MRAVANREIEKFGLYSTIPNARLSGTGDAIIYDRYNPTPRYWDYSESTIGLQGAIHNRTADASALRQSLEQTAKTALPSWVVDQAKTSLQQMNIAPAQSFSPR